MSSSLKRRWSTIEALPRLTRQEQKVLLQHGDPALIRALAEICNNLLQDRIPLDKDQKRKLSRFKAILRKLASKSKSVKDKRKILVQRGCFLSSLIPLVASVVSAIVSATT